MIRAVVPGAGASPPTSMALIPDAFVVPGYILMGYGFANMLRRRRASEDDPARIDAMLVGLAAAFMCWTYLIVPSMAQTDLTPLRIANSFFPVADVVLLVLVAQLALSGGARQPSLWLLMTAASAMFAGDFIFMLRDGGLADVPTHAIDVLFMTTFLFVGAAGLHPSMRTLTEPQQIVVKDLSKVRTTLIALLVVVPTIITSLQPSGPLLNSIVSADLCALLILAVFARVVRSNNSRARAERATRRRATHDALTDLPNRELLAETIAHWGDRTADEDQEISLLFIDLDRFKMVNDHWGHQVGDELLCEVADVAQRADPRRGPGLPDRRRRVRHRAGQPVALGPRGIARRPGARRIRPPVRALRRQRRDLRVHRRREGARWRPGPRTDPGRRHRDVQGQGQRPQRVRPVRHVAARRGP
nr:hypothetical protein GCM10020092_024960 [Actinoplanes digitatis]